MNLKKILRGLMILILMISSAGIKAQESKKLYDPSLDGMKQINAAIAQAMSTGKHVLIQYGGNWCPWCIRFDAFCKADTAISGIINSNYVPVKLNYSPENKNDSANEFLGNPTRFGFPVFIIVDGKGKVIHIQDSGLLEEGKGYSREMVIRFFTLWTPSSLVPKVKK